MPINENIRAIRLKKKLTQKQIGDACGLADATIRMYELGKANPKPATVAKIAKALDVSIAELYGVEWSEVSGSQSPEVSSTLYQAFLADKGGALPIDVPHQDRLLAAYNKLNEEGQLELIKRAEEMGEIPAYQSSLGLYIHLTDFTDEDRERIEGSIRTLKNAELELKQMQEQHPPVPDNNNAVLSAKQFSSTAKKEIEDVLLAALGHQLETSPDIISKIIQLFSPQQ